MEMFPTELLCTFSQDKMVKIELEFKASKNGECKSMLSFCPSTLETIERIPTEEISYANKNDFSQGLESQ